MDSGVQEFLQAMAHIGQKRSRGKSPYLAHIVKVKRGIATLDNGVVVKIPGKAADWPAGSRVLVLSGSMSPKAVKAS